MKTLYIVAAGNNTRMDLPGYPAMYPKALMSINGMPVIENTIRKIGKFFDSIVVITSNKHKPFWSEFFQSLYETDRKLISNVESYTIESGLGDGHALLKAIVNRGRSCKTDTTVCWGDVYFPDDYLIEEMLSIPMSNGIVPYHLEYAPYVALIPNKDGTIGWAEFSKLGETNAAGCHDLSVFRFDGLKLYSALHHLHASLWKGDKYMTPNGELSTLYVLHYMSNTGNPVSMYESGFKTFGFNDAIEFNKIKELV